MHTSSFLSAPSATNAETLHDADPQILRHKPFSQMNNSPRSNALRLCAVTELLRVIGSPSGSLTPGLPDSLTPSP